MKDLAKRPFKHYDWTDSELLFAMTFTDKKERILVGTKEGIQAHLRQKGAAAPAGLRSDCFMFMWFILLFQC